MKVIIAGGGSVGRYTAREMVAAGHTVTIIDNDRATLRDLERQRTLAASGRPQEQEGVSHGARHRRGGAPA